MSFGTIFQPDGSVLINTDAEIDDILLMIGAADSKIEKYKKLKAYRAKQIDAEIEKQEALKEKLRQAITDYMIKEKEKSLKFPGTGKVTRRTAEGKWIIKDEEGLIKHLKANLSADNLALVLTETPKLTKKELNKFFEAWEVQNNIPKDLIEKEPSKETITVTLEKDGDIEEKIKQIKHDSDEAENTPAYTDKTASYDGLDF